jgi:uncharacterized protein YfaS (alpha-2-macroglobulin family)
MADMHEHVLGQLDDFVHGLVDADKATEIEEHCAACPECKTALQQARQRLSTMRTLPPIEASEQLIQTTIDRVDKHVERWRRWQWRYIVWTSSVAAAAAVLLVAFSIYYSNLQASPYDLAILGQRDLYAAAPGSLRVRLSDVHNQTAALDKVPVAVELRDKEGRTEKLAEFTTDDDGTGQPTFTTPDWPAGEYELRLVAKVKGSDEVLTRPVKLLHSSKLMLTSDKPIYQPGQEIHVRALALRQPDLKPVAERDAVFTIADPKGNIVFKRKAPTSKFGITSIDCPLASELIEGPYRIACKVGETETGLQVEVKKYVLPRFKVEVAMDRPYYKPGDTVQGTVKAHYFNGDPLKNAAVEMTTTYVHGGPARFAAPHKVKTDEQGVARITFPLPKNDPFITATGTRLRLQALVTDAADMKESGAAERMVALEAVRVQVLAESGKLVRGVPNRVFILVTEADGTPVRRARLTITGIEDEVRTDAHGIAAFEVTPKSAGLQLAVRVLNDQGEELIFKQVNLEDGGEGSDFLVRSDKAVYQGGDTMKLTALGSSGSVYVDLIKLGKEPQSVRGERLVVKDGKADAAITLPPELFGTVKVCAYRYLGANSMLLKTKVVYIHKPGELKIGANLDQAQYRPGGKANVNFTLSDARGRPTAGALSLAAVDESVFFVLPQTPGSERGFYTIDEAALAPVYALVPNWSPSTNADGREDLEQALFSATARTEHIEKEEVVTNKPQQATPMRGRGQRTVRAMAVDAGPPDAVRPPEMPAGPSHSLVAESYQTKAVAVEELRSQRLNTLFRAFLCLIGFVVLAVYIGVWLVAPVWEMVKIHLVALPFILVPATALVLLMFFSPIAWSPMQETFSSRSSRAPMPAVGGVATMDEAAPQRAIQGEPATRWKNVRPAGPQDPNLSNDERSSAPRVREEFPETLLWRPQIITDDQGRYTLPLDLADSITTWKLSASAVNVDGNLGSTTVPIRVTQDFFLDLALPVSLTRNDEITVPVVLHNEVKKKQTITLKLRQADWFTCLDDAERKVDLEPGQVQPVRFRIKAAKVGTQTIRVEAEGTGLSDVVQREIEVIPDGRRVEQPTSGNLQTPADVHLTVPETAIEGSVRAYLKLYPSGFAQLVEGLGSIFRMPYGCFEQTSSTTYPNVLALDYLKRTNQSKPDVEKQARHFIQVGYQRLLTFEVAGGGFDWYGRGPANVRLTAYGLMEFSDMARVHEVDPRMIQRTRDWLLAQRKADGSWGPDFTMVGRSARADSEGLMSTAYVAWAVFADKEAASQSGRTRDYLLGHAPADIHDTYTLALVCNALLAIDADKAGPYLDRLDSIKKTEDDGKKVYWDRDPTARTAFHGAGLSGDIEATALATLALLQANRFPGTCSSAQAWLVSKKDPQGTWYSTQATVLSLKALLMGSTKPRTDVERRIEVRLGKTFRKTIVIPPDQAEVMQMLDLTPQLTTGTQRLTVTETSKTGIGYQVAFRYHLPKVEEKTPLAVAIRFDRDNVRVNERIQVRAEVRNDMPQTARMLLAELPVPPGFVVDLSELTKQVGKGVIDRVEPQPRRVLVYFNTLESKRTLALPYALEARLPANVTTPAARVYEYYAPERQGFSPEARLTISP